jgi:hypothetical protein
MAALLLTGWRKPARAEPRSLRGGESLNQTGGAGPPRPVGVVVDHLDTPVYRRAGVVRRILALVTSGGLAVLIGVLAAIITAFGIAVAVIWMTNLLQQ